MFDTIILLTGQVEEPTLTAVLRGHNPRLNIRAVQSATELAAIDQGILARARLVAFATAVVVPAKILKALGFGAYNFHPGPPTYPGWVPSHFAIYDKAGHFGVTAHIMVEQVDAGPIVGCKLFGIPDGATVTRLQAMAFMELARLFWHLALRLATVPEPLPELPIQWSGSKSTRRMHAAKCDIPVEISKEELDRRIAAFGDSLFDIWPTVTLHGYRFKYCAPQAEPALEAPTVMPAPKIAASA